MAEATVQSVERTFQLMETLALHPRGMGLVELAGQTGLNKSTAHRLLGCLHGLGYVVKDSFSGHYRLTYKLLELSNGMLDDIDVLSAAKQHLDLLSEETGETVHLMVVDEAQGVYVYKSEPRRTGSVQMRSRVGLRVPLANTAAGKAMLALGSQETAQAVFVACGGEAVTPHTITDPERFLEELDLVRSRGWAVDNEENELGVRCIGAAIPDHMGRALAAMSISANVVKMTHQRLEELAPLMLECRDRICRDMGQGR